MVTVIPSIMWCLPVVVLVALVALVALAGGRVGRARPVAGLVVALGCGFGARLGPDILGPLTPSLLALTPFVLTRSPKKYYVN